MGVIWREETILWGERVRLSQILISPMIYKDKVVFLASHISYMESNEISEKIEMDL